MIDEKSFADAGTGMDFDACKEAGYVGNKASRNKITVTVKKMREYNLLIKEYKKRPVVSQRRRIRGSTLIVIIY